MILGGQLGRLGQGVERRGLREQLLDLLRPVLGRRQGAPSARRASCSAVPPAPDRRAGTGRRRAASPTAWSRTIRVTPSTPFRRYSMSNEWPCPAATMTASNRSRSSGCTTLRHRGDGCRPGGVAAHDPFDARHGVDARHRAVGADLGDPDVRVRRAHHGLQPPLRLLGVGAGDALGGHVDDDAVDEQPAVLPARREVLAHPARHAVYADDPERRRDRHALGELHVRLGGAVHAPGRSGARRTPSRCGRAGRLAAEQPVPAGAAVRHDEVVRHGRLAAEHVDREFLGGALHRVADPAHVLTSRNEPLGQPRHHGAGRRAGTAGLALRKPFHGLAGRSSPESQARFGLGGSPLGDHHAPQCSSICRGTAQGRAERAVPGFYRQERVTA